MIGTSFITDLHQAFRGNDHTWWTHSEMRLPVEETRNAFEIFISGKLLQNHMADGTLLGMDGGGKPYPVVPGDVTVRLNNWDKVRASILARTTVSGFGLGVSVTLLAAGLIRRFRGKDSED
jgi:hypothetical protein